MNLTQSRRASLGIGSTPKLDRRLQLRRLFDEIDTDRNGALSVAELHNEIVRNASLHDLFSAVYPEEEELFAAMDTNGDGLITWEEFMVGSVRCPLPSSISHLVASRPASLTSPLPHSTAAAIDVGRRASRSSTTSRPTRWEG